MPLIFIDNVPYEVESGQNILQASLSLGLNLPYFCWHPAMGSVGACRLCAVQQFKDEEDTQGKLVMGCMTPAKNGTRVSINHPEAAAFRKNVLEWLMINHPHDCPICDEGGECHLQDMTVMTGHAYREFRFNKRTYRNQYLGPLINHEMNRCIQCYRCVRFYNDYAGGDDLQAFAAHDHVYFGRHEDGVLQSEFSGNLVEVCPTGVFTDKTLKQHYTRKWDLQTAPSICGHCGLGCNTIPGERYGQLRRIRNRYNYEVNGYFLCDRGRYGYEYVNSPQRIRQPLLRRQNDENAEPAGSQDALEHAASIIKNSKGVVGIGSPRASLESNFALQQLVGPDNFCTGLAEKEQQLTTRILQILQQGPARSPSLRQVREADAVLILGEDVTNTAPLMALAVRQAVRNQPLEISRGLNIPDWHDAAVREAIQDQIGPLFVATPTATKLDDVATQTYHAAPADIARLGFAVAHQLDANAPTVPDLPEEAQALVQTAAEALKEAQRPLVISGLSLGSEAVIDAAANVAQALSRAEQPASLAFVVPEGNTIGVSLLSNHSLADALPAVENGSADTVIIAENDLFRRLDPARVETLLTQAKHVIALDHLQNATTARAEVVLPAGTFAESSGTLVNNEGRAQRFYTVFEPGDAIQASWRWLAQLADPTGAGPNLDEIMARLGETWPIFASITDITPLADFRVAGQKIPRQPHRYSGRTAMRANVTVHEPQPVDDPDSPLAYSMEGFQGQPPPGLISRFWSPGWNSVQAVNKFQSEVGGPLYGGDSGRRLLEPAGENNAAYFESVPAAFKARPNEWLVLPIHHIFGSEELSSHTPGLAHLTPEPYLAVPPTLADELGLKPGHSVKLRLAANHYVLPVELKPDLPAGVTDLPVGLPGLPDWALPAWGRIKTEEQ